MKTKKRYRTELRRNAAVHSKELPVDYAANWNQIKRLHADIVDVLIIFIKAFVTKIKELSHLSAFVVAADKVNRFRKVDLLQKKNLLKLDSDFDRIEKNQNFDGKLTTIHKISEE